MNVMIREFLRSLKKNFTRFLSILAIIALGVGFFAGINATRPDMVKSAAAYYSELNLMDLRSLNPLGYSPEDIAQLRAVEGIDQLQSSYTKDLFLVREDQKLAARLYSMDLVTYHEPKTLNQLVLKEGRLPERSGEIVLAAGKYQDMDLSVGQTVRFAEDEGNDLAKVLKDQDYTIVGLVESPLYISFEFEHTNIGNGQLATFVYVPAEDFTLEEPTEFFFSIEGAGQLRPDTDEYRNLVDPVKARVDEIGKTVMAKETADLLAELEDSKATLRREKADAEKKLADAKATLDQAETDLATAETTLIDEEAKGRQEIADGRKEILENRQKLLDGRVKYNEGYLEWQKGNNEYLAGKAKLDSATLELATAKAQLDSAKMQIDAGKAMLKQNEATMESSEEQIKLFGDIVKGLNEARDSIPDAPTMTEEEYNQLLAQIEEVSPETASYIRTFIPYTSPEAPAAIRSFLDTSLETVNASYASAKAAYDAGKAQYDQAKKDLAAGEKEYKSGLAEYNAGKKKLDQSAKELAEGKKELDAGKKKLDESRKELDDGEVELSQAQLDLDNGEAELDTKVEEGWKKISDGKTELDKGRAEYDVQKADAEEKLAEADDKIMDAERKILDIPDQWFVSTRDGNPSYTSWFDNADKIGRVAVVFPFFFFLVAALVSLTTMTRMVEEERVQAGTLKALGYSAGYIAGKYIAYALLASLAGSVLGLFIGFNLFPRVIIQAYQMMYNVPAAVIEFNPTYAALSIGFAVLSTVGATLAAVYSEIRERPASLMQPKAPPAGKRILLERITPLWRRLSFSRKVTFRNLFLYKKRFWMTVLGISGCTALILTGFGIKDSVDAIMGNQFKELFIFDQIVSVDSKKPASERNLDQILSQVDSVDSYALGQQLTMKVHVPGSDRTYDARLTIPEKPGKLSGFVVLRDRRSGQALPLPDDGVVITEKMADQTGLKIGDEMSYEDGDRRQYKAVISGIAENYIENYIYISPRYYQSTHFLKPDYDMAWLKLTEEGLADENGVQEELMAQDAVLGIFSASETSKTFNDQMKSLIYVVLVLIASAGTLAFIVLYNLSNVNITERVRELATIKVLGFRDTEVSAYVYRENIFLTLFGALFGLALGASLHQFIIQTMEIENMMFGKVIYWPSYLLAFALTFLFSAIVNFVMHFALKRINMVESLKSLE
ncbi:hypothetical protein DSECCO2_387460 [anaerobic digester metagenome]